MVFPHLVSQAASPEDGRAMVAKQLLTSSRSLREPNFKRIDAQDLQRMFELYDQQFFGGSLRSLVHTSVADRLSFRVSSRLTRAGGKTTRIRTSARETSRRKESYEIALAGSLLMLSFTSADRPTLVCGHTCTDRLDAAMRIMEHEIVHLVEMLQVGRSSCRAAPFQRMARECFGHHAFTHGLVLPEEHAATLHGVKLGQMVSFTQSGRRLIGRVNRIHRRATVLVPDANGQRFSDGGRYARWYVPLQALRPAGDY